MSSGRASPTNSYYTGDMFNSPRRTGTDSSHILLLLQSCRRQSRPVHQGLRCPSPDSRSTRQEATSPSRDQLSREARRLPGHLQEQREAGAGGQVALAGVPSLGHGRLGPHDGKVGRRSGKGHLQQE